MAASETAKTVRRQKDGKGPRQVLSAMAYAWVAGAGLVVGIGLLFFYIFEVPKLIENAVQKQVFYIVLIPWGLSAAAFLFGTMRSYARYSNTSFGKIELAGPVVLFCFVVVGGFKLIPQEPFNVTVRASCQEGNCPEITVGKITLQYGVASRDEDIGPHAEANFKGIPGEFKGKDVKIIPHLAGYAAEPKVVKLQELLELPLSPTKRHLLGSITPSSLNPSNIRFFVEGAPVDVKWNRPGSFDIFPVYGSGDIRLKICAEPNFEYDDLVGGRADVHLNKVTSRDFEKICGAK